MDGIPGQSVALADRSCIAYMGTLVRNGTHSAFCFLETVRIDEKFIHLSPGHGSGIVIATGEETEFGVIFSMMQEVGFLSYMKFFDSIIIG